MSYSIIKYSRGLKAHCITHMGFEQKSKDQNKNKEDYEGG